MLNKNVETTLNTLLGRYYNIGVYISHTHLNANIHMQLMQE